MSLEISVSEANELLKENKVTLLDVREDFEISASKLNYKFKHIPLHELMPRIDELNKEKPVLVLCHHGHRSMIATNYLTVLEFNALSIRGGIEEWSKVVDKNIPRYQKFPNKTAKVIS
jgi:rhodanese-related sulfurtransferase